MDNAQHLTAREKLQQQIIKERDDEIKRLKRALNALVSTPDDDVGEDYEDEEMKHGEVDEFADDGPSEQLVEAFWDGESRVHRCAVCAWEVVDCVCSQCGREHICRGHDDDIQGIVTTDNEVILSDRRLVPRGDTPLLEIPGRSSAAAPAEYGADRIGEYNALLQRGATRLMCETYHLEYKLDKGIIAWADPSLFEEFAGPKMLVGDFWKICLGRRIALDPLDPDGSMFIEDLLDEILYYPIRPSISERVEDRWETIEESSGIWLTRPMVGKEPHEPEEQEPTSSSYLPGEQSDDENGQQLELQDDALDPERRVVRGATAIKPNEYEVTEADQEDVADVGPGGLWYREVGGEDDTAYDSGDDGDYAEDDVGTRVKLEDGTDVIDLEMSYESEHGSDWDPDEILSGDEEARSIAQAWWPQTTNLSFSHPSS